MAIIDRIYPLYAFIFSVFRLGQPTKRSFLDAFLPAKVIEALIETGLLQQRGKYWQMPEIGIMLLGSMYFVSGLPEVYPTVKRGAIFKPVDYSVRMMMDEIALQPVGSDFLEVNADYGILANRAAAKGFANIQIHPKHADYIPFIQINLALNDCEGEIITDFSQSEYDLITCIHLSAKQKLERRNLNISDEKDIIQLYPVIRQLKETGKAIIFMESIGSINEIIANRQLKEIDGFNIHSVVMNKMPYLSYAMTGYNQSSWEKQFELVPHEYIDYVQKTMDSSERKAFVYTQLLKINKSNKNAPYVLCPFYNPKYSDPLYNYASLTV